MESDTSQSSNPEYEDLANRMASLLHIEEKEYEVPADLTEARNEHKYSLVITTITRREYVINIFYNMLQRSWQPSGNIEISSFGKAVYLVYFGLGCDYNTVITRSPRGLNEDLLLLEKCDPDKIPEEYEFKYADFTVQVHGLPMSSQTTKIVEFVASKIGFPYPINPSEQTKWRSFARVRVKVDVTEPIRQELVFTLPSKKKCKAKLRYERLHKVCFFCGRFGHIMKQCPDLSRECEKLGFFSPETFMEKMQDMKVARFTEEINVNYWTRITQFNQSSAKQQESSRGMQEDDDVRSKNPDSAFGQDITNIISTFHSPKEDIHARDNSATKNSHARDNSATQIIANSQSNKETTKNLPTIQPGKNQSPAHQAINTNSHAVTTGAKKPSTFEPIRKPSPITITQPPKPLPTHEINSQQPIPNHQKPSSPNPTSIIHTAKKPLWELPSATKILLHPRTNTTPTPILHQITFQKNLSPSHL